MPDTFPLITHITFTTKKTETAVNLPNNNRKTNRKFDPKVNQFFNSDKNSRMVWQKIWHNIDCRFLCFFHQISRPVKRESFPKISHVTFPSKNEINMNDGCWDQRKNNNIFDLSVSFQFYIFRYKLGRIMSTFVNNFGITFRMNFVNCSKIDFQFKNVIFL